MKKELPTKYDHLAVEKGKYQQWLDKEYFKAGDLTKKPYSIVIPPPNVTGILHIGHAWDNTLQDIISRYKRMRGYDMLYLPGMDHAGIATQAKVDARLKGEGISRYDIGREKFLERAWQWKEEYASTIRKQWAKLGNSLDYSRERFTMDDGFNAAVRHVFVSLYNEGLIYRGWRIINWDPEARTALSNIEVYYQEDAGKMYYMHYHTVEDNEEFIVATTRPETMFGDVCVVVNPDDEDNKHLIGKHCINPANGKELPIIGDTYIEIGFGTGIMKCTPAHDPNDYAIAQRHGLDKPICMNPDGTMNALCGRYEGMDRYECREELVKEFEANNVMDHIEEISHQVAHSERTHCVVEPYLSEQWFVKMKPLAEDVLKNQENPEERINFYPERFSRTFSQWLENIEDWCISRQFWWGHRIPAWYNKNTGEILVSEEDPTDLENWVQDEDVLDTWFSSALWPFSTLGWPKNTADLERYFPNDVLVTGYDIIFFWVARMAFQTRYCMKNRPFKDVLIHGLVRDTQGRKMSKSLGNGIDPMDVIQEKGADALRFFLTTNSTPGQDLRFDETKMDASWNFINKIWNAARYVQMQIGDTKPELDMTKANSVDKWILARFNEVLDHVSTNMDKYELAIVGNELYSFVWDDFCSWYIELSKATLYSEDESLVANTKAVLYTVMMGILKVLSPFMPFVTEEIYLNLPHEKESLNVETWPEKVEFEYTDAEKDEMALVISAIQTVREIKVEYSMKPSEDLTISLHNDNGYVALNTESTAILARMAHATVKEDLNTEDVLSRTIEKAVLTVAMDALIDLEEEKGKLEKEIARLENEIKRCSGMLKNPGFVNKAPEAKVNAEKEKLASYTEKLEMTKTQLDNILKKLG